MLSSKLIPFLKANSLAFLLGSTPKTLLFFDLIYFKKSPVPAPISRALLASFFNEMIKFNLFCKAIFFII